MKTLLPLLVATLGLAALTGCVRTRIVGAPGGDTGSAATSAWSSDAARQAVKIETTMSAAGAMQETEYHIRPDEVPQAVRDAMEARHPGGRVIGAEKEWNDGVLYYELAKDIDGFEVEAMFHPDGRLHESEIQVPAEDVPAAVREAITGAYPEAGVRHWEVIRGPDDAVRAYHVKLDHGEQALKVIATPEGTLTKALREIPAEIEVPVALP